MLSFSLLFFLLQINLDKDPSDVAISSEIFTALKKSNMACFQILAHLLTCLGLDYIISALSTHSQTIRFDFFILYCGGISYYIIFYIIQPSFDHFNIT